MKRLREENITGSILQHMNHTEDLILRGDKACRYVVGTLKDIFHILKKEASRSSITVKLDGAPNVICASNYKGQMFVGTKYAFKAGTSTLRTEKLAFSKDQLDQASSNDGVREKLSLLLKALPYIDIPKDEIWSGDYLFSQEDLRTRIIDGEECVCFHPNTIVYAVPKSDPLSKTLTKSKFGIAWHTKYKGSDFENLHVSFDVDISQIQEVPGVFQMDATLPSSELSLDEEDERLIKSSISAIEQKLTEILGSSFYSKLQNNPQFITYLDTYRNALIRLGNQEPTSLGFFKWLEARYNKTIENKKTQKAREEWTRKKEEMLAFISSQNLDTLYYVQNQVRALKEFYIYKLDQITSLRTYLKYSDKDYRKANAEGYAVSDAEGNVQKIVSRLEFSRANFSQEVLKGWTSDKREVENLGDERALRALKESEAEDTVEGVKKLLNLEDKKPPESTYKGTHLKYTLNPADSESRESKAYKVANAIEGANFSKNGTTPIVDFKKDGIYVKLIFKPKSNAGAVDTKGDEIYWAYCMASIQNGRGENLPASEEDIKNFDLKSITGEVSPAKPKPSNLKGYVEGSYSFCEKCLIPGEPYLFFRESLCINLVNNFTYESLHTLINSAAYKIRGRGFKKDTWNPSDVIACSVNAYDSFRNEWEEALRKEPTFESMNSILLKYLRSKEVVGVSLKDIIGDVHVAEINTSSEEEARETLTLKYITYPPVLTSSQMKSQFPRSIKTGVTSNLIREDGTEVILQYRLFGKTTMQVEGSEKGFGAKLGKTGKFILNDLYQELGVEEGGELNSTQSLILMKSTPEILKEKIDFIEANIGTLSLVHSGPELNYANFQELIQTPKNGEEECDMSIWPRIIDFLYMLTKASLEERNYIYDILYRGAKKELDWCAPYIKLY